MAVVFKELPLQSKSPRQLYLLCYFAQGSISGEI